MRINILIPTPAGPTGETWGETPFARSLARAFGELGVSTRIVHFPKYRWLARFSLRRGDDLIIRGPHNFTPGVWPWTRTYIWLISFGDLRPAELKRTRHFFVASAGFTARLQARGLPDLGVQMSSASAPADAEAVGLAIDAALREYEGRKQARLALAEHVRQHHSFAARARRILEVLS